MAVPESYHKVQPKPKTVSEFKNALRIMWFALPEKAIDNVDFRKRLQGAGMCVSQR